MAGAGQTAQIINHGAINLNGAADFANGATILQIGTASGGTVQLSGGGTVTLSGGANSITGGVSGGLDTLENVDNTIAGVGLFDANGGIAVINDANGVIAATVAGQVLKFQTSQTVVNNGVLKADGGTLAVYDAVTGTGSAVVTDYGTLRLDASFNENVAFEGPGTLALAQTYSGTIEGFTHGETIDLTNLQYDGSVSNYSLAAGSGPNDVIVTVQEGAASYSLQFEQTPALMQGDLTLAPDGGTGTRILFGSPPILSGGGNTVDYFVGGSPASIDSALVAGDPSSATLSGATVEFAYGFLVAGDELNFTNQNGIDGAYDAATGVLSLTGIASVADYQAALDSIAYGSSAADPTAANADPIRVVDWTVTDGTVASNTVADTIVIARHGIKLYPGGTEKNGGAIVGDGYGVEIYGGKGRSPTPGRSRRTGSLPMASGCRTAARSPIPGPSPTSAPSGKGPTASSSRMAGRNQPYGGRITAAGTYDSSGRRFCDRHSQRERRADVTNQGYIGAFGYDAYWRLMQDGSTLTNAGIDQRQGLLQSRSHCQGGGSSPTRDRSPTTAALAAGVYFQNGGGTVINQMGGTIDGIGGSGVVAGMAAITVNNQDGGLIKGTDVGVLFGNSYNPTPHGGVVHNYAGGMISGYDGIANYGTLSASATVTNAGSIFGTKANGVHWNGGGAVVNQTGGIISGAALGVYFTGGAGTVTDAGAISGTTASVEFGGSGANTLTLQTGATLTGDAIGSKASGATNALVLQGAGTANANFDNFNTLKVQTSGSWTLGGVSTIGATTLSTGALTIAGALTTAIAQSAGTTASVWSGDSLTSMGTSSLAGTVSGAGTLAVAGGTATLASGAKLSVANWSISGAGTAVTVGGNLTYSGSFGEGAGSTVVVSGGETLTLTGTTAIGGTVSGAGTLALAGGAATIAIGAKLSVANWSVSGAGTAVTVGGNVMYAGSFIQGAGSMVGVSSGDTLTLSKTTGLSGTIAGAGTLNLGGGASTVNAGAALTVANWSLTGGGTTTIAENLSYAGTFVDGQLPSLVINSGDTLTLTGASTLTGAIGGAGALALGGGATMISAAAALNFASWTISGAATSVTIGKNLSYAGPFTLGAGSTVGMSGGDTLTLTGTSKLAGTVAGAGTLALAGGAATIASGAALTVANWSLSGSATATLGESSSYAGSFSEGATLTILNGNALTLTGKSNFSGIVQGAGALALAGGAATIASGAKLSVANWSISGAATSATVAASLTVRRVFHARLGIDAEYFERRDADADEDRQFERRHRRRGDIRPRRRRDFQRRRDADGGELVADGRRHDDDRGKSELRAYADGAAAPGHRHRWRGFADADRRLDAGGRDRRRGRVDAGRRRDHDQRRGGAQRRQLVDFGRDGDDRQESFVRRNVRRRRGIDAQRLRRRYADADRAVELRRDDERGGNAGAGRGRRGDDRRRGEALGRQLVDRGRGDGRDAEREPDLRRVFHRWRGLDAERLERRYVDVDGSEEPERRHRRRGNAEPRRRQPRR